jgi:hypothetical protein
VFPISRVGDLREQSAVDRPGAELDEVEPTVANLVLTSPGEALLETLEARKAFAELASAGVVERFAGGETQRDFGAATSDAGVWGEARGEGRTEFTRCHPNRMELHRE